MNSEKENRASVSRALLDSIASRLNAVDLPVLQLSEENGDNNTGAVGYFDEAALLSVRADELRPMQAEALLTPMQAEALLTPMQAEALLTMREEIARRDKPTVLKALKAEDMPVRGGESNELADALRDLIEKARAGDEAAKKKIAIGFRSGQDPHTSAMLATMNHDQRRRYTAQLKKAAKAKKRFNEATKNSKRKR